MNTRELEIKKKYEQQGWKMLRGGAPDFIAIKVDSNGDIVQFKGIEVKSDGADLSYEQAVYKKLFEHTGIPFIVEVEK